jgi:hypothetical protein
MADRWMPRSGFLQNRRAPVLPLSLAGSSVCEKIGSAIEAMPAIMMTTSLFQNIFPFLVQPQGVGSFPTMARI